MNRSPPKSKVGFGGNVKVGGSNNEMAAITGGGRIGLRNEMRTVLGQPQQKRP